MQHSSKHKWNCNQSINEELIKTLNIFGKNLNPDSFFKDIVKPLNNWIDRIKEYQEILRQDDVRKKHIQMELNKAQDKGNLLNMLIQFKNLEKQVRKNLNFLVG